jgi:hypothetical protein
LLLETAVQRGLSGGIRARPASSDLGLLSDLQCVIDLDQRRFVLRIECVPYLQGSGPGSTTHASRIIAGSRGAGTHGFDSGTGSPRAPAWQASSSFSRPCVSAPWSRTARAAGSSAARWPAMRSDRHGHVAHSQLTMSQPCSWLSMPKVAQCELTNAVPHLLANALRADVLEFEGRLLADDLSLIPRLAVCSGCDGFHVGLPSG